jgi:hypothetical protein
MIARNTRMLAYARVALKPQITRDIGSMSIKLKLKNNFLACVIVAINKSGKNPVFAITIQV